MSRYEDGLQDTAQPTTETACNSRFPTPLENSLDGLALPALINLVIPQVFPQTLVTGSLPRNDLENLKILGKINTGLTHKERAILFCAYSQFHSCLLDPKPDLPGFAESVNWGFQDFALTGWAWPARKGIMRNVAYAVSKMEGDEIPEEEASRRWAAVLERILPQVEQHYDPSLFRTFNVLKRMEKPDGSSCSRAITLRLKIVYDFCLAYIQAGYLDSLRPLPEFWYQEMGGNHDARQAFGLFFDRLQEGPQEIAYQWDDVFRSATIVFVGFQAVRQFSRGQPLLIDDYQRFYDSLDRIPIPRDIAPAERDCIEVYKLEIKKVLDSGVPVKALNPGGK
ncbi:MAG: hypothetical protein M1840_000444 [Geoglossum simile]|nr:MAG: hypothetical protein M1840_000444 [Geoglossum simile]